MRVEEQERKDGTHQAANGPIESLRPDLHSPGDEHVTCTALAASKAPILRVSQTSHSLVRL